MNGTSNLRSLASRLRSGRSALGAFAAALHLTAILIILPAPAAAQSIALSPSAATVDQNSQIFLSAAVVPGGGSSGPPCGSINYGPCSWTWTLTGTGASLGTTDSPSNPYGSPFGSGAAFASQFTPGTYTVTVSRAGLPAASMQIKVNPLVITISGPSQVPQGETARFVAALTGMAYGGGSDKSVTWTLNGGGTQIPDSPCTSCDTQATTYTAGYTAGNFLLTAQSVKEPAVSTSRVITVLPPPAAAISPTAATFAAGLQSHNCFTATTINTSDPGVNWWTDDADGGMNASGSNTACLAHDPTKPGGVLHVYAQSDAGGTVATATVQMIVARVSPSAIVVPPGTSRQFLADVTGSPQAAQTRWSTTVPGGQISAGGLLRVPAGTAAGTYAVSVQTVASPVAAATAAVTVAATIPVTGVALSPARSIVDSGQQEGLTAVVLGQNGEPHLNQAVTWSVAGPAAAAVASSGLFTAPATPGVYVVTAAALADPTKSATATVTVGEDLMVSPSWASLPLGGSQAFRAQVTGAANPAVAWSVAEGAAGGAVSSAGVYTAPAAAGTYHVVAVAAAAGQAVQGIATVTVGAAPQIALAVAPASTVLARGATRQFTAAVTGSTDTAVAWAASAGSIDAGGLFTAPPTLGTVTITATSHADGRVRAAASALVADAGQIQPFQYDANGNLLADGLRTYEWDAENRLAAINVGTHRSEFGYDGLGRRAMIIESDQGAVTSKRHYIWVGGEMVEERDATATTATIPRRLARAAVVRPRRAADGALAATAAGDNAAFVAQSVPAAMVAGGVYSASVTLSNTGTTTWTAAASYRLGSSNPQNNATWGLARVYLAAGEAIAPGQQKTFTFNVKAPATAGTYHFQWQLVQENVAWIGAVTPDLAIAVASSPAANLAQFVAQSVPTSMVAGSSYTVSVTMQNAGTAVWTAAGNVRLGSSNPQNNAIWGPARGYLASGDSVAQGQQKTFTLTITAPATPGTYNFQWQMLVENVAWFGDLTPNVAVSVVAATQLAQYVSQSMPATIATGATVPVSIAFRNTGTAAWTAAASYRLGSSNPQNNTTWGVPRAYLDPADSIGHGQLKTFTFLVTAPSVPGTYNFQWQMVQDGVAWFGDLTPNLAVSVTVPVEPVLTRFFPGGMQSAGANYYFSYDHLGSVREVTDASGQVAARYDYDPFGRLTINLGAPPRLGFAGTFYHAPSGLGLTMYRAYDPDLGRWESRDPIDFDGGLNLYAYAGGDPENTIDPLGLKPCDPFVAPKRPKHLPAGPHPQLCPGAKGGVCPPAPPLAPTPVKPPPLRLPDPSPADPCHGNGPCFTGPNPLPNFDPKSTDDPRSPCFGASSNDWLWRPDCYGPGWTSTDVDEPEATHPNPQDEGKEVPRIVAPPRFVPPPGIVD